MRSVRTEKQRISVGSTSDSTLCCSRITSRDRLNLTDLLDEPVLMNLLHPVCMSILLYSSTLMGTAADRKRSQFK